MQVLDFGAEIADERELDAGTSGPACMDGEGGGSVYL
jgi:hypothetical protein